MEELRSTERLVRRDRGSQEADRGAVGSCSPRLLGEISSPPTPLTSPPPQGGVQPDYASQWAQYYRSQGMAREAEMIETYVRGKERSLTWSSSTQETPPSPPSRT